jgi:hypothetical protein
MVLFKKQKTSTKNQKKKENRKPAVVSVEKKHAVWIHSVIV